MEFRDFRPFLCRLGFHRWRDECVIDDASIHPVRSLILQRCDRRHCPEYRQVIR